MVGEDEFDEPNGLCFSPDEKLIYVNDSPRAHVKVFDVAADGALVNGRMLYEGIGTGGGQGQRRRHGVRRARQRLDDRPGRCLDHHARAASCSVCVETSEVCGSLAWGGADLRSLFLTTTTTLHSVPTLVRSARVPGNH